MATIQPAVDRYKKALSIPSRLIELHPGTVGHSGPASAIAPAVVLMSISAFEGFIEDVTATVLQIQGESYARIARLVGNWTNPDISKWHDELKRTFGVELSAGFSVRTTRGVPSHNWSPKVVSYAEGAKLGSAWMNVRHALTHGGAAGRGAERWPTAIKPTTQPCSLVLRSNQTDELKHHLELPGARGCAALYTFAARHGAAALAVKAGLTTPNWAGFPDFDPA